MWKKSCTMNLHLHGHLASCIREHGPVYSFWLFSFERLNGVMEAFHTNAHNISAQLLKRFLAIHSNSTSHWPQEYQEKFSPLLEKHRFNKGSLSQASFDTAIEAKPIPPLFETVLEPHLMVYLKECLQEMLSEEITVLPLIRKCAAVSVNGNIIGSKQSRYTTSPVVMANKPPNTTYLELAEIQFFFWW